MTEVLVYLKNTTRHAQRESDIMFYSFTQDEIHTILYALYELKVNLDQRDLIENIKTQMFHNNFKAKRSVA